MTQPGSQRGLQSFLIMMLMVCEAQAAGLDAVEMPEVLRGINQATGTCRRQDVVAGGTVSKSQASSGTKVKIPCAVTPGELDGLKAKLETVLVDVRTRRDPTLPELSGALAMPVAAVGTKAFLRGKTVVLLGDGRGERDLLEACDALLARGYKVKFLQGGVPNWPTTSSALSASHGPEPLAAADLWAESQFDANLVLLSPKQSALKSHFPVAVLLPDLAPSTVKAQVEHWRKERKQAYLSSVVLVVAPEEGEVRLLRESLRPLPVLAYADSAEAYVRYQDQQKAVWAAHARGPRQPGCGL